MVEPRAGQPGGEPVRGIGDGNPAHGCRRILTGSGLLSPQLSRHGSRTDDHCPSPEEDS
jgi:hypothetical protein